MVNWKTILVAHSHFVFATPPLHVSGRFMFVLRRRNNFLGSRIISSINLVAMSPLALLHVEHDHDKEHDHDHDHDREIMRMGVPEVSDTGILARKGKWPTVKGADNSWQLFLRARFSSAGFLHFQRKSFCLNVSCFTAAGHYCWKVLIR